MGGRGVRKCVEDLSWSLRTPHNGGMDPLEKASSSARVVFPTGSKGLGGKSRDALMPPGGREGHSQEEDSNPHLSPGTH